MAGKAFILSGLRTWSAYVSTQRIAANVNKVQDRPVRVRGLADARARRLGDSQLRWICLHPLTPGAPGRRDLLDHVIVLNERHLKRLMNEYVRYYHEDRTHLALDKGTPAGRGAVSKSGMGGRIIAMPRLGGLHHRYDLAA